MLKPVNLKRFISFASKPIFLLSLIFVLNLFLRLYTLEERVPFSWDQVDNAWAAKNIIVDHKFPLIGMQAKQNSGIFIGPAYYYVVAVFYFLTKLDPIASAIIATISSILTFFAIYFVTKKLFGNTTALISLILYSVASPFIIQDRYQWPVNLLPFVSVLIFYNLSNIFWGNSRHVLYLAVLLGFAFHLHFTAVFFVLIVLLSLPFFKWSKEMVIKSIFAGCIFLAWFSPLFIHEIVSNKQNTHGLESYIGSYYHGVHFVRIIQIANDAFIQFEPLMLFKGFNLMKYTFIPVFAFLLLRNKKKKKAYELIYLTTIFFLVPWLVFSTYRGEISDYYFSITKPLAAIIVGYILFNMLRVKRTLLKMFVVIYICAFVFVNIGIYTSKKMHGLSYYRAKVKKMITYGQEVEYIDGVGESYLYYIYKQHEKR